MEPFSLSSSRATRFPPSPYASAYRISRPGLVSRRAFPPSCRRFDDLSGSRKRCPPPPTPRKRGARARPARTRIAPHRWAPCQVGARAEAAHFARARHEAAHEAARDTGRGDTPRLLAHEDAPARPGKAPPPPAAPPGEGAGGGAGGGAIRRFWLPEGEGEGPPRDGEGDGGSPVPGLFPATPIRPPLPCSPPFVAPVGSRAARARACASDTECVSDTHRVCPTPSVCRTHTACVRHRVCVRHRAPLARAVSGDGRERAGRHCRVAAAAGRGIERQAAAVHVLARFKNATFRSWTHSRVVRVGRGAQSPSSGRLMCCGAANLAA